MSIWGRDKYYKILCFVEEMLVTYLQTTFITILPKILVLFKRIQSIKFCIAHVL